ncbi:FbpB family small basic protein [Bacillus dakarensis]|uniref:FbpB family small basic protein n=1 Tax=Robertmurraya dakarensis TaxID=1926278 RepID=UPI00137AE5DA|nr:FbpB family small basic protein [Bacillus dakarensis]
MRKQLLNMRALISANKKEILGNKKEIARIEKQIDDKHVRKLQALRKRDNNSLAID